MKSNFNGELKEYFDSLPKFVQETIMQTNAQILTKKDLESIANKITKADSGETKMHYPTL